MQAAAVAAEGPTGVLEGREKLRLDGPTNRPRVWHRCTGQQEVAARAGHLEKLA